MSCVRTCSLADGVSFSFDHHLSVTLSFNENQMCVLSCFREWLDLTVGLLSYIIILHERSDNAPSGHS